jgi:AraC-type DNA-binding domain-containing proteins
MTGFGDPYYFSRRFKQLMGCTPSEYEARMKGAQSHE